MHVCTMADSVGTSPAGASQLEDQKTCKLHPICFQYEHNPPQRKLTCRVPRLVACYSVCTFTPEELLVGPFVAVGAEKADRLASNWW